MNSDLEKILLKRGGLFRPHGDDPAYVWQVFNTTVSRFSRHLERARIHLYQDRPRPIEFGLVSASTLRAFCYTTPVDDIKPFDFIGVNFGAPFTLIDIFGRMLAHPDIFPNVGDPKKESYSIPQCEYLTTDVISSGHEPVTPNCPIRSVFAGELAQVALDFLFFHELTHLHHGHFEFLEQNPDMKKKKSVCQALEIDADSGSIFHLLNSAFHRKNALATPLDSVPPDVFAAIKAAYATPQSAVKTINFAAYILFRIFNISEWFWEKQTDLTYPLPPLRMSFIGSTLFEIFSQRPEYEYDALDFMKDNANVVLSAEIACGIVLGNDPDMRGIVSVIKNPESLEYLDQFKSTWTEIRPLLEKHKRGGILPP